MASVIGSPVFLADPSCPRIADLNQPVRRPWWKRRGAHRARSLVDRARYATAKTKSNRLAMVNAKRMTKIRNGLSMSLVLQWGMGGGGRDEAHFRDASAGIAEKRAVPYGGPNYLV